MGPATHELTSAAGPRSQEWPPGGLERVHQCPACAGTERELLHAGLTDRLFGCAAGTWSLWRCATCGSAYLDPRPTQETILLAYGEYFTHDDARRSSGRLGSADFARRSRTAISTAGTELVCDLLRAWGRRSSGSFRCGA